MKKITIQLSEESIVAQVARSINSIIYAVREVEVS